MTLKGLRQNTGMTILEAAVSLGLSERQMYRLEDGTTPTRRLHWLAMSVVYGVPVKAVEQAAQGTLRSARPDKKGGKA